MSVGLFACVCAYIYYTTHIAVLGVLHRLESGRFASFILFTPTLSNFNTSYSTL